MDIMNVEEYKTWIGGIARRFNPTFHVRMKKPRISWFFS